MIPAVRELSRRSPVGPSIPTLGRQSVGPAVPLRLQLVLLLLLEAFLTFPRLLSKFSPNEELGDLGCPPALHA